MAEIQVIKRVIRPHAEWFYALGIKQGKIAIYGCRPSLIVFDEPAKHVVGSTYATVRSTSSNIERVQKELSAIDSSTLNELIRDKASIDIICGR